MNVRRLFPFALFALLFATAIRPTIDPDMWWHLKTGEAILAEGIPRVDAFSFTHFGGDWLAHEWLAEILMWNIHNLLGLGGLMVFFAAVTLATWGLVYALCDAKPYLAGMVVALAAKSSELVWGARPQLFNLLFFAWFMFLMERRKSGALGHWIYWTFPPVTLLWANLHSGFLLGIILLLTYLVGEVLERQRRLPDSRVLARGDLKLLGISVALSLAVSLANPRGYLLWLFPFENLTSSVQRELIAEWAPPAPDQLVFYLLVLLFAAGLLGLIRSSRKATASELLLFFGTTIGAALSARNIPIFAIVAAPIIARHLGELLPWERLVSPARRTPAERVRTIAAGVVIAALAVAMSLTTIRDNDAEIGRVFPVAAVDWLEESGRDDSRIFNAYNFGGYLIWRGIPVYVDGRADLYGDSGLTSFAEVYSVRPGWDQNLVSEEIELIITEADSSLAAAARGNPGWDHIYEDQVASIFCATEFC